MRDVLAGALESDAEIEVCVAGGDDDLAASIARFRPDVLVTGSHTASWAQVSPRVRTFVVNAGQAGTQRVEWRPVLVELGDLSIAALIAAMKTMLVDDRPGDGSKGSSPCSTRQ